MVPLIILSLSHSLLHRGLELLEVFVMTVEAGRHATLGERAGSRYGCEATSPCPQAVHECDVLSAVCDGRGGEYTLVNERKSLDVAKG